MLTKRKIVFVKHDLEGVKEYRGKNLDPPTTTSELHRTPKSDSDSDINSGKSFFKGIFFRVNFRVILMQQ